MSSSRGLFSSICVSIMSIVYLEYQTQDLYIGSTAVWFWITWWMSIFVSQVDSSIQLFFLLRTVCRNAFQMLDWASVMMLVLLLCEGIGDLVCINVFNHFMLFNCFYLKQI